MLSHSAAVQKQNMCAAVMVTSAAEGAASGYGYNRFNESNDDTNNPYGYGVATGRRFVDRQRRNDGNDIANRQESNNEADDNNPYGYGDAPGRTFQQEEASADNPYGYGEAGGRRFDREENKDTKEGDAHKERRASIQAIMKDPKLTPEERRKSIQGLMDGRRRSSNARGGNSSSVEAQVRDSAIRMEKSRPECNHYERNCTIISPCCGLAFGCRICHDEYPELPPPLCGVPDGEADQHQIDRFAIAEIICRQCYTRQSSKTNRCKKCKVQFAEYHCAICNLWLSDEDKPYHCKDCGFCRLGGADNFVHCKACGICLDKNLYASHACKAGKYNANCPICQENLFSSREASHDLPCGHTLHWHCYEQYAAFDSRCPVCKKSTEDPENMQEMWSAMNDAIISQPMPLEYTKVVDILCNDCEDRSTDRRWHVLGTQCIHCSSFNTTVETIKLTGEDAILFLEGYANGDAPPTTNELHEEDIYPQDNDHNHEEDAESVESVVELGDSGEEIYIPRNWNLPRADGDEDDDDENAVTQRTMDEEHYEDGDAVEFTNAGDEIYIPSAWRIA